MPNLFVMKQQPWWLALAALGILGVSLAATTSQSASAVSRIPIPRTCGGDHGPVPVADLEYFPVVNYAGRAIASDVILVGPGERLAILGMNAAAVGQGSLSRASLFRIPILDAPYAEGMLSLSYVQAGIPLVVLDEGSYILAEYPGADPSSRLVHERALVGYRVSSLP